MASGFRGVIGPLFFGMAFLGLTSCLVAQQAGPTAAVGTDPSAQTAPIPDAPTPQIEVALAADPQSGQEQNSSQPASASAPSAGSSQSQSAPSGATRTDPTDAGSSSGLKNAATQSSQSQQTDGQQSKQQMQHIEVTEEEHQRVLGIAPNFNLTYRHNAVSLTAAQKIDLAFHASVDPFTFAAAFMVAGYHEALDEDTGFGWGAEGYFKRSGAAYLDAVDSDMIGNGFLPALLHQDPRYFRLGEGTIKHRILYAVATNFIAKHDNTGRWEPNYSNIGGNIITGALSNLYYPSQNSGWGQTIANGMIVTIEGGFGSLFDEFWPDISRHYLHRDPTHGLDAEQSAPADANSSGTKEIASDSDTSNPPTQK